MFVLEPDLTYAKGAFLPALGVQCDAETGMITQVGPVMDLSGDRIRLQGRALMPGFVNAHSHSFQRLIRGRTQWRPTRDSADFWSWRDEMYAAALALSADEVYDVARLCFLEMLTAGFTTVGEFHYLQRDEGGKSYDDPLELHRRVLQAAADTGIRIVLLNTAYVTGGVNAQLRWTQRRFATPELDEYLATSERLKRVVTDYPNASMGLAPHSVRAVPREWLKPLAEWARINSVPVHMHVSEQVAEVEACAAAYGMRPIELLATEGLLDARVTAIHATHTSTHEVALLARARAFVCACPGTERDLGDGFLPATSLHQAGVRVAIGTDSQTIIDPLEEIRLIEYHERLRRMERVLISNDAKERSHVAPTLLRMGSAHGAAALQVQAGAIEAGRAADLIALDLNDLSIAGHTADTLDAMLALSAQPGVVRDVWVAGRQVIADRRHNDTPSIMQKFKKVSTRLW